LPLVAARSAQPPTRCVQPADPAHTPPEPRACVCAHMQPLPLQESGESLLLPMASALVLAVSRGHIATAAVVVAMTPHSVDEEDGVSACAALHVAPPWCFPSSSGGAGSVDFQQTLCGGPFVWGHFVHAPLLRL